MAEANYYDDESEAPATPQQSSDKEDIEPQSALVPKSFFAGKENLEVGDVERVKVLRIMDDEVEVECIKEGYNEEKKEAPVPEEDEMMA